MSPKNMFELTVCCRVWEGVKIKLKLVVCYQLVKYFFLLIECVDGVKQTNEKQNKTKQKCNLM